jgi:hypothetical protein
VSARASGLATEGAKKTLQAPQRRARQGDGGSLIRREKKWGEGGRWGVLSNFWTASFNSLRMFVKSGVISYLLGRGGVLHELLPVHFRFHFVLPTPLSPHHVHHSRAVCNMLSGDVPQQNSSKWF